MTMIRRAVIATLICATAAPAFAAPSRAARTVEQHIQGVTGGLRTAVEIKGAPPAKHDLRSQMDALHVPGVAIAVIRGGKVEWARGFGVTRQGGEPVTADTLFQAGSVSKPVAAMAILAVVQDGRLSLDTDVNKTLKSWRLPDSPFTATTPVTLRALLSHTAGTTVHGFAGYAAGAPVPTLPQVLSGTAPANSAPVVVDRAVGSAYRYSGGGYSIAQQMVVDATGQTFPAVVRDKVLARLNMTRSTEDQPLDVARSAHVAWPHDAKGAPVAGGPHTYPEMAAAGLWTTANDLARFVIDLAKSANGESGHVLSPKTARDMLTPVKSDYGLGLSVRGDTARKYFYHNGSNAGYKAVLLGYPDTGDGVVVLTNGDQGYQLSEAIIRAVAVEYGWPDYHPIERPVVSLGAAEQAKFAGTFTLGDAGDFTIRRDGDRLVADIWTGVVDPLFPDTQSSFFITAQDLKIVFSDPDHGMLSLRGDEMAFTRKPVK
ncbi:serine hydrolase domain-containing protein [Caulobacter segnis]|uniref:serine hydrolase domain-containing protein n=1 Tax=Caulobacter segnis TaxID=88688 RepID=UPI00285C4829|nr:serine hydrolase domain-containing protein [Caulobacter segnis]MDR6626445.1 CubicO group peptidase (beta-lactamase class C family) [Caulobacter segnis]